MPELGHDAPSLADVGSRLNRDWLVQWIMAPDRMRNKTTMPRALARYDDAAALRAAEDIAAYLRTLKRDAPVRAEKTSRRAARQ